LLQYAKDRILEKIENHRDNFNFLKRSIVPLRDSLFYLKTIKDDETNGLIQNDTFNFFIRLHQKSLELLEQIESDMSSLESASNFYFSEQSRKMNEIIFFKITSKQSCCGLYTFDFG